MHPADFKRWRKSLGLSQKEAANALGLKRRMVQYYEKGERDGDAVVIPVSVRLACYAIAHGITDYRGPEDEAEPKTKGKSKAKQAKGKQKDRAKPDQKSKKDRSPKKPEDKAASAAPVEASQDDKPAVPTDANGAPSSPPRRSSRAASKTLTSPVRKTPVRPKPARPAGAKSTVARSRKPDGGKPPA